MSINIRCNAIAFNCCCFYLPFYAIPIIASYKVLQIYYMKILIILHNVNLRNSHYGLNDKIALKEITDI